MACYADQILAPLAPMAKCFLPFEKRASLCHFLCSFFLFRGSPSNFRVEQNLKIPRKRRKKWLMQQPAIHPISQQAIQLIIQTATEPATHIFNQLPSHTASNLASQQATKSPNKTPSQPVSQPCSHIATEPPSQQPSLPAI